VKKIKILGHAETPGLGDEIEKDYFQKQFDGKDLEHTGVSPDIYVDTNFKDRVEGKDPQLDRAIEEINTEWKK